LIINNAAITTTTTITATTRVGTAPGVDVVGVVTELIEEVLVGTLVEVNVLDVDVLVVVDVVTELIEVLLVGTLVEIILTVPEPRLAT